LPLHEHAFYRRVVGLTWKARGGERSTFDGRDATGRSTHTSRTSAAPDDLPGAVGVRTGGRALHWSVRGRDRGNGRGRSHRGRPAGCRGRSRV